jgi:hypothetical protein
MNTSGGAVFTDWKPKHTLLWDFQPLVLQHRLHENPLFSRQALAALIDAYPPDMYKLVHMGQQGDSRKLWRHGVIGEATGAQTIEAIATGRLWINLLHVNEVDPRYGALLDQIFAEIEDRVPNYATFSRINGILISSPRAQVYYHFDPAGQSLWQIEGRKRVYLYPPCAPFLTPQHLEHVALYHDEVGVSYEPWFDEHAMVHELQPGEMMHWPLNSPHRIENLDCLNISMTSEFYTRDIRRKQMVNFANGMLREKLHLNPARQISGAGFWSKAVLQAAARRVGMFEGERKRRTQPSFKLDPEHPGQVIDLSA